MASEGVQANIAALLTGIDRYNPENLGKLEHYVGMQCDTNTYNLEANLAVLKLYQFNPSHFQMYVTQQILMKALTNLPHKDFTLCKCLIDAPKPGEETFDTYMKIMELADLLETCQFKTFWAAIVTCPELTMGINGFEDSIRKFICHVVNITYQHIKFAHLQELLGSIHPDQVYSWISKYGWKDMGDGNIFIAIQDESVKTKNITEKITFESVAEIMAMSRPIKP